VLHIRALIGDYHVFWLSAIGLASAAVILGALIDRVSRGGVAGDPGPLLRRATTIVAPGLVILGLTTSAVSRLQRERVTPYLVGDNGAAYEIAQAIAAKVPAIGTRPVLRTEPSRWAVFAGVLVELDKTGVPFAVDELAELAGPRLAPIGTEDLLVIISGPERHAQMTQDRRVHPLGSSRGGVYVDAVRFADAPEYRHW